MLERRHNLQNVGESAALLFVQFVFDERKYIMGYRINLLSLGCEKNRVDSEVMLSILSKEGHKIVDDPNEADVGIINTCGFIKDAKEESIEEILYFITSFASVKIPVLSPVGEINSISNISA